MPSVRRRLFNLLCVVSLLACVGAAALWARSHRQPAGGDDHVSWLLGGERFTLRSDRGRLALFRPPPFDPGLRPTHRLRTPAEVPSEPADQVPPGRWAAMRPPPDPGLTLAAAVARISNAEVGWRVAPPPSGGPPTSVGRVVRTRIQLGSTAALFRAQTYGGTPAGEPCEDPPAFPPAEAAAALLGALEDADRYVAAHVLLGDIRAPNAASDGLPLVPRPGGGGVADVDGLSVGFPLWPGARPAGHPADAADREPRIDSLIDLTLTPSSTIRDQWHRRLDVRVAAVPHLWLTAATALPPAVWLVLHVRDRRSRRRSRCRTCGCDLRATPRRCPDCGTIPAGIADTPDPDPRATAAAAGPAA